MAPTLSRVIPRCVPVLLLLLGVLLIPTFSLADISPTSETSTDIYYQTPGVPLSDPVHEIDSGYPKIPFVNNRVLIWLVTQQHTYFGGFVLALPFFTMLLEFLGLTRRTPESASRYDGLARDILRVALLALSMTAVLGAAMLGAFIALYPGFMSYMGTTFKSMMPLYAGVFVGESLLLILYYYTWEKLHSHGNKWIHLSIGAAANAMGVILLLLANGWASFMMAPAGVDAEGRFLGNMWHLLHSPLWNPLNAHRFFSRLDVWWSGGGGLRGLSVFEVQLQRGSCVL